MTAIIYCPACGWERTVTLRCDAARIMPTIPCPDCGADTEIEFPKEQGEDK